MQIDKGFEIELAAAQDDTRPVLNHVQITRYKGQPVAVAGDGFILAVVPIELDDEDVTGLVSVSAFRKARRAPKPNGKITMTLTSTEWVVLTDRSLVTRRNPYSNARVSFPDYVRAVNEAFDKYKIAEAEKKGTAQIAFNPKNMRLMQKVLNIDCVQLSMTASDAAIFVTDKFLGDKLEPPFGVVMPMAINSGTQGMYKRR